MIISFPILYKRTNTGAIQLWRMELEGAKYRTISGQQGGKETASEWTVAEPKNVGRSNATTAEQQAELELLAKYTLKREQGHYFDSIFDIDKETYFAPMLAEKFDPDRLEGAFYVQPKHNGVRGIISKFETKIVITSRKGNEFVNCPHIGAELKEFFELYPKAILDGELYNHDLKNDFKAIISAIKKTKPTAATIELAKEVVEFHIYDFPSQPGNFGERWQALTEAFGTVLPENKTIRMSPTWKSTDLKTIQGLHQKNLAKGYEGTIVRLDAPYENKRTYALMKYKDFKDAEYPILDLLEGKGNWSGVAKIAKMKLPPGVTSAAGNDWFGAGIKGTKEECRKMLADKADYIGKPGTIVYFDETPDGVPLFPIFHGVVRDYE